MTISYNQSTLRKLANKEGFQKAHAALMEKWNIILKDYFSKKD